MDMQVEGTKTGRIPVKRLRHDHKDLLLAMQQAGLFEVVVALNDLSTTKKFKAVEGVCKNWNLGRFRKNYPTDTETWFRPMKHGDLYLFVRVE